MTLAERGKKIGVSKQRMFQIEHHKKGLCNSCSEKLSTAFYCLKHAIKNREAQRKRLGNKRKNDSLTRRLEKIK